MATIQEIIDSVLASTLRYDKTVQITGYVKKAIKHIHVLADFDADLTSTTLVIGSETTLGSFTLPADFRKPKLVRPLSSGSFISGVKFTKINPAAIPELTLDGNVDNTYYIAGNQLSFQSEVSISSIGLLYYKYPDLSSLSNSTWATINFEEAIADFALAQFKVATGDRETASNLINLWQLFATDVVNTIS